ncbi:SDR family oxidoreductase [Paenibacillus sp. 598K]|uniref:SDR family NAD(P)-dependent oxidoreductase n=1 Tax=Paenibacillus sp. 598K TaxID=1117987 RepID=UPI000FF9D95E|nr:SDR family NAD(P)-dependent oxidoreductase [Paenibacillus sp. 598K]GBF74827.1 SDR family oxidoreductase [Paenibacillus sp. 598K]
MHHQANGYTALITGASSGIGLALTRKLLEEGWEVAALIRSDLPTDEPLLQESRKLGRLRIYKADVSSFASLRQGLEQIKTGETSIDVLFNNAGGSFDKLMYSPQGRELHYEVQTVAPYIITRELIEHLKRGRLKRVVHTSSNAFDFLKAFDAAALARPTAFKKLIGPYAATKLAMSLWTQAAAAAMEQEHGIVMRSVDPGPNNTIRKGNGSGLPFYVRPLMKFFFPPPTSGARLLYDGAMGDAPAGSLLAKGKVKALPYAAQAPAVLAQMEQIYRDEYCLGSPVDRVSVQ